MTEHKQNLLLVDDDEAFTRVLSRAMQRRGFAVQTAHTINEAIALLKQHIFAKAVVDLKMTGESGISLIPQLKQAQPAIEIVMLTGYASIATAVEAVKLGAINYLCKPANSDEILAAFKCSEGDSHIAIPENRPSVDRVEWEYIQKILNEQQGNVSATARALGMHRRTLQRKLQKRPVKK